MNYPNLMADAEANWPADEASLTFDTFAGRMADAQSEDDRKEDSRAFRNDIAHMHRVFAREGDAAQLCARYDAEIVARFKARHSRAFASLAEYAAEDAGTLLALEPVLGAKSLAEMVAARETLYQFLPCSVFIYEMHSELSRLAP